MLDAVSRDVLTRPLETPGAKAAISSFRRQLQVARGLGPGAVLLMPWLAPAQVAVSITDAAKKTPEDEEALQIARQLGEIIRPYASDWLSSQRTARPSPSQLGKALRTALPR